MLVLSRKIGERIMIGNNVIVTVLERKGNRICIGIEAPPNVRIFREEIYDPNDKKKEQNSGRGRRDSRQLDR